MILAPRRRTGRPSKYQPEFQRDAVAVEVVAADVMHVPVGSLLALAEGGYAVEVERDSGSGLVAVEVGEVLDGRAEIDGAVEVGDTVVVAT